MAKVKVNVSVGIGAWLAARTVYLVAAPHVGDTIAVGDAAVMCERVHIAPNAVYVEETVRFESQQEAERYFE